MINVQIVGVEDDSLHVEVETHRWCGSYEAFMADEEAAIGLTPGQVRGIHAKAERLIARIDRFLFPGTADYVE